MTQISLNENCQKTMGFVFTNSPKKALFIDNLDKFKTISSDYDMAVVLGNENISETSRDTNSTIQVGKTQSL